MRIFLACSWTERRLLITAMVLLGVIKLGLTLLPFRVLLRFVEGTARRSGFSTPSDDGAASQIAWAVLAAPYLLPQSIRHVTCLPQAFATQVLLGWYGIRGDLQIGVMSDANGELMAHAWVAQGGRVLVGDLPNLDTFVPLLRPTPTGDPVHG